MKGEYTLNEFAAISEDAAKFVAVVRFESPRCTTIEVWNAGITEAWHAGRGSDGFPVGGPPPRGAAAQVVAEVLGVSP